MHIPKSPDNKEFSSEGESFGEEIPVIFNPATSEPPIFMNEEEWLDTFAGILSIPTLYNEATMGFAETDED